MDSGTGKWEIKEVYGKDREQVKVGKIIAVLEIRQRQRMFYYWKNLAGFLPDR